LTGALLSDVPYYFKKNKGFDLPKKKKPEIKEDRKQKFIELVAMGKKPYRACIEAGYSIGYARKNASDLQEKYKNEIEALKPIKQQAIQEEFKYTALDSFRKFQEIQALAMLPDKKGNYNNLNAAAKCEENKARLFGAYETDNSQRAPERLKITVIRKEDEEV
jgi:hypothetical protein